MPLLVKTQQVAARLVNARQCEWSPYSAELPDQWLECGEGRLMSGIRCLSDYCGNVGIYCCAAQVK